MSKAKFENEVNGTLHAIISAYLKFAKDHLDDRDAQTDKYNCCKRMWVEFIHKKSVMKKAAKYGVGIFPDAFKKGVVIYEQNKVDIR